MKQLIPFIVTCSITILLACNTEKNMHNNKDQEKVIKDYFAGWVNKDWNQVERNLANGFTFTSPAPDDHIPLQKFREKCWVQATYIKHFDFLRFATDANGSFVTYTLHTTDGSSFRNTEYFEFANDKVKSIEVFFGLGEGSEGFPTNKK
jgi:hypothetical protein